MSGPLTRDPGVRRFYTTSSCGVCGKGALEEVAVLSAPVSAEPDDRPRAAAELPNRLDQPGFRRTGGLHATGLFDAGGELLCAREDVGRHNAMDKVVGRALMDGLPAAERPRAVRERAALLRARSEGGGGRRPHPHRRRRARARWRSSWPTIAA